MHTLFPSPKTEQGIKGGVVLLRLNPPNNGANVPLRLAVSYVDREGRQFRWGGPWLLEGRALGLACLAVIQASGVSTLQSPGFHKGMPCHTAPAAPP